MDRPTQLLSDYAATLTYDELTEAAVHGIKRCLVDSVACALGGFGGEPSRIARAMAREVSATSPARVLFTGDPTSAELAAFANTVMVRYLDCNDIYRAKEGGHPSDTIGAVLAVADAAGADGRAAILGMAIAYEVFCALGEMVNLGLHSLDHVLNTAIASALGAGSILKLANEQMAHAAALALAPNLALRVSRSGHLSMWKGAAAGNAARNGVFAAQLAALGMTGPSEPFHGGKGLFELLGEELTLPPLGGRDADFHAGVINMKYFPSDYHAQGHIWAAIDLRRQLAPSDIAELHAFIHDFGYHEIGEGEAKWNVRERETADHSLPYLIAAAFLDGDIGPAQFTPDRIADPAIHNLIARVRVHNDPGLTRRQDNGFITARLEAVTTGGERTAVEIDSPKGHFRNPLADAELEAKFRRFGDGLLPSPSQDAALQELWQLDQAPNLDPIMKALQLPTVP